MVVHLHLSRPESPVYLKAILSKETSAHKMDLSRESVSVAQPELLSVYLGKFHLSIAQMSPPKNAYFQTIAYLGTQDKRNYFHEFSSQFS